MHLTHMIIDDFFDKPNEARKTILAMDYPPRPEKAYYPGRNAASPLNLQGVENVISDVVRERVVPAEQTSHSVPRIAMRGDVARISVHIDNCHWSALIFMTPNEYCKGGTHFFRHKKTGWDSAPVWPGMPEEGGYENSREAVQSILDEDGNDRSKWEETMMIPMKFNRLVVFRSYLWHDAGVSFGDTLQNSRLIIPLFFETVNPNP